MHTHKYLYLLDMKPSEHLENNSIIFSAVILIKIWKYFLEWVRLVLINWPIVILPSLYPLLLFDCPTQLTVAWQVPNNTAEKSAALPPLNITPTFSLHCILLTVEHSWGKHDYFVFEMQVSKKSLVKGLGDNVKSEELYSWMKWLQYI